MLTRVHWAVAPLLVLSASLVAQQETPVGTLLDSARVAFLRAEYDRAEAFASQVVEDWHRASAQERILAVQLLAMSRAPGLALPPDPGQPIVSRAAARGTGQVAALVTEGINALNLLDYPQAAARAASALELAPPGHPERIRALQLKASAVLSQQRADSARFLIEEVNRLDPFTELMGSVRTPALAEMFEEVRETTFGFHAQLLFSSLPIGAFREALIAVASNRSATYSLLAIDAAGIDTVLLDQTDPTRQGVLYINFLVRDPQVADSQIVRPLLRSGTYKLAVVGVEEVSAVSGAPERVVREFSATFEAGALVLDDSIPSLLDPNTLLPERAREPFRTVLVGFAVGAGMALLGTAFGGDPPVEGVSNDRRGLVIGGAVALGTIVAAFTDQGREVPENILENERRREEFVAHVRERRMRNDELISAYRARVRLDFWRRP